MVLGLSQTFTLLHVAISLIAIATGIVVVLGMLSNKRLDRWTAAFLFTTAATTATGFLFPITGLTPALIVGGISTGTVAVAVVALYPKRLEGSWRWVYVAGAVVSLYLNAFVLVVQTFLKIPFFNALAPTGKEPPFLVAQGSVFALFVVAGVLAAKRFHPAARAAAYA